MKRRSGKRIIFDFVFLSIHVGKWVVPIFALVVMYQRMPLLIWPFIFLILGIYILGDLYRGLKAIIKDTTTDNLESEGEFSYVKGIDPKVLTSAKNLLLMYLAIFVFGIVGIVNNVNAWKEDGQNRVGNIAIMSLFATARIV